MSSINTATALVDESRIAQVKAKWQNLTQSGRKSDRQRVREGLGQAYNAIGLPAPRVVLWVDSPWELREAAMILVRWFDPISGDIRNKAHTQRPKMLHSGLTLVALDDLQGKLTPYHQVNADNRISEIMISTEIDEQSHEGLGERLIIGMATELLKAYSKGPNRQAMTFDIAQEAFMRISEVGAFFQIATLRAMLPDQRTPSPKVKYWFNSSGCGISPPVIDYIVNGLGLAAFDYFAGMQILAEENVWWAPFRDVAIVCDPPVVNRYEEGGAAPAESGAVVQYANGDALYMIDRLVVPSRYVTHWPDVTASEVLNERNAEVRRVLMKKFGYQRMLDDLQAVLVSQDDFGELYRIPLHGTTNVIGTSRTFEQLVKVTNKTAEPDGSFKTYVLHVANWGLHTAHEAVASTFGLRHEDYKPEWES